MIHSLAHLVIAIAIAECVAVASSAVLSARSILLHNGRIIDTTVAVPYSQEQHPSPDLATLSLREREASGQTSVFFVHLDPAHNRSSLEAEHGVHLLDMVSPNSFVVETSHASIRDLNADPDVLWVGHVQMADKLAPNTACEVVTESDTSTALPDNKYLLDVRLVSVFPLRNASVQQEIANSFRSLLATNAINATTSPVSRNRVQVCLHSAETLCRAAQVLASTPQALFIERRMPLTLSNRWASGIVLNGASTPDVDYSIRSNTLSGKYDLRGQHQVIGVADTGIDTNNCFLRDSRATASSVHLKYVPGRPSPADVAVAGGAGTRTLVSYVEFVDAVDDAVGHGTHVAGIIAGSPETGSVSLSEFSGLASASKLAFFDIGTLIGGQQKLNVPSEVGDAMLHWSYLSGARIYSISWGVKSNGYTSISLDVDEYMWRNKDFIVVVAAGNDGSCRESGTINSPATAKNVIAVGASMNALAAYKHSEKFPPFFNTRKPAAFGEDAIAHFSSIGPTSDRRIKPDIVAPGYAILSARSGTSKMCSADEKDILQLMSGTSMSAPAVAAALALVRQYFEEGFYPTGYRRSADALHPSGSLMKAMVVAGARMMHDAYRTLLSSANKQCSSPDGFYAAKPRSGQQLHDFEQGWGRVQLSNILEFGEEPERDAIHLHLPGHRKGPPDQVFNDPLLQSSGDDHEYKFCAASRAGGGGVVRVVLVWTDAPSTQIAGAQLVNDLDLEVTYNSKTYLGNGKVDRLNPVEVVQFVVEASASNIEIRVSASAINIGPQPYSLVVSGPVRFASCSMVEMNNVHDGKDHIPTPSELSTSSPVRRSENSTPESNEEQLASGNDLAHDQPILSWLSKQNSLVLAVELVLLISLVWLLFKSRSSICRTNRDRQPRQQPVPFTPASSQPPEDTRGFQSFLGIPRDPDFSLQHSPQTKRDFYWNQRSSEAYWADSGRRMDGNELANEKRTP